MLFVVLAAVAALAALAAGGGPAEQRDGAFSVGVFCNTAPTIKPEGRW
jgi:hypothetical protein